MEDEKLITLKEMLNDLYEYIYDNFITRDKYEELAKHLEPEKESDCKKIDINSSHDLNKYICEYGNIECSTNENTLFCGIAGKYPQFGDAENTVKLVNIILQFKYNVFSQTECSLLDSYLNNNYDKSIYYRIMLFIYKLIDIQSGNLDMLFDVLRNVDWRY